jgi:hypothetical protein
MSLVCYGEPKKIFTTLKILDSLSNPGVSLRRGGFRNRVMVSLVAIINRFIFSSRKALAGLHMSVVLPVR